MDWDGFRATYDRMTYADVAAFYAEVYDEHPDQFHHSPTHLDAFFDEPATHVVEVGGWRGEAAARILAKHPEIESWTNYEICEPAATSPITEDARYRAPICDTWVWDMPPQPADTAVLAHLIEHLKASQLNSLVEWLAESGVSRMYVEAPIRQEARSWRRSTSAHLLEWGWTQVVEMFGAYGYSVESRYDDPPERHVLIFAR